MSRVLVAAIVAAVVGTYLAGCRSDTSTNEDTVSGRDCSAEPLAPVNVFPASQDPPLNQSFEAIAVAIGAVSDLGFQSITFETTEGDSVAITFGELPRDLPLEEGRTYTVRLDYRPGFPSSCGIIIGDESGLLFAGASDQRIGGSVLSEGVPGFELELLELECASRPTGDCYEALRNLALRVTHENEQTVIPHGEYTQAGPYEVTCHVAQDVDYSDACADAGLHRVSYSIVRLDPSR